MSTIAELEREVERLRKQLFAEQELHAEEIARLTEFNDALRQENDHLINELQFKVYCPHCEARLMS